MEEKAYDRLFRQQVATGAIARWSELNPSLMAAPVLNSGNVNPGRTCSLCLATDHSRAECALSSLEVGKPQQWPTPIL